MRDTTTPDDVKQPTIDHLAAWIPRLNDYPPGEFIKELPEPALMQYVAVEFHHAAPQRLLDLHGFELIKEIVSGLCEEYGHGMRDAKYINNPAGILDRRLKDAHAYAAIYRNGSRGRIGDAYEKAKRPVWPVYEDGDDNNPQPLNQGSLF